MARITFADDQGGTQNVYELPINPYNVQPMDDSDLITETDVLDGSPVVFEKNDTREHELIWRDIPREEPYISMIDELYSYRRGEKYMSFKDIAILLKKSSAYFKIFVIDLDLEAKAGHIGKYNQIVFRYLIL